MNLLRLRSTSLLPALAVGAMFACGGISDPTRSDGPVATVKGSLTGTAVPAGAHVALVWRKASGGVEVGADVPIVAGQFSMSLAAPPDAYFVPAEGNDYDTLNGGAVPPTTSDTAGSAPSQGGDAPSSGTGTGTGGTGGAMKLTPRTEVSGGITQPMTVAIAGFVVYVDANGNGKLDVTGDYAASPDTILGGNKELMLAYLKGGGQLDYEKLRDRSGILPAEGYNLAWDKGRWLPLDLVELKLQSNAKLPSTVCSSGGASFGSGGGSGGSDIAPSNPPPDTATPEPAPAPVEVDASAPPQDGGPAPGNGSGGSYPAPNDPYLHCSPDGRSFYYAPPPDCPPPPPPPVGLCASDMTEPTACAGAAYPNETFSGDTPPPGWPCPVANSGADASAPPPVEVDAGPFDAGAN